MSKSAILKAIKENCIECMGGQVSEVKMCELEKCKLYKYRLGKDPDRTPRVMTEEQRAAAAERLKKAREIQNEAR